MFKYNTMSTTKPLEQKKALAFMFGGSAIFTFKSLKTQDHLTYKCTFNDPQKCFFVRYLTGNYNTTDYTYLCKVEIIDNLPLITPGFKVSKENKYLVAFKFVVSYLMVEREMTKLQIWHEGRCCRCGRPLTVPESIESGIGPECIKRVSLSWFGGE